MMKLISEKGMIFDYNLNNVTDSSIVDLLKTVCEVLNGGEHHKNKKENNYKHSHPEIHDEFLGNTQEYVIALT